jgi:hypothetical protein
MRHLLCMPEPGASCEIIRRVRVCARAERRGCGFEIIPVRSPGSAVEPSSARDSHLRFRHQSTDSGGLAPTPADQSTSPAAGAVPATTSVARNVPTKPVLPASVCACLPPVLKSRKQFYKPFDLCDSRLAKSLAEVYCDLSFSRIATHRKGVELSSW